jgi:hypothetical protein
VSEQKKIPASLATGGDSIEQLLKINDASSLTGLTDGVQAAHVFSPDAWRADAVAAVHVLAASGRIFTVDHVRRAGISDPDKPQRWGALFAVMRNSGVIHCVGMREHRIKAGDSQLIRQWRGTASARGRAS